MSDVHLISAEQASHLEAALWMRRADDPLPACPICDEHPAETVAWTDDQFRQVVTFVGCGHRISVDPQSLADWYATETPWTRRFEEMAHQRQVEERRAQGLRRYLDRLVGADEAEAG